MVRHLPPAFDIEERAPAVNLKAATEIGEGSFPEPTTVPGTSATAPLGTMEESFETLTSAMERLGPDRCLAAAAHIGAFCAFAAFSSFSTRPASPSSVFTRFMQTTLLLITKMRGKGFLGGHCVFFPQAHSFSGLNPRSH